MCSWEQKSTGFLPLEFFKGSLNTSFFLFIMQVWSPRLLPNAGLDVCMAPRFHRRNLAQFLHMEECSWLLHTHEYSYMTCACECCPDTGLAEKFARVLCSWVIRWLWTTNSIFFRNHKISLLTICSSEPRFPWGNKWKWFLENSQMNMLLRHVFIFTDEKWQN